MRRFEVVRSDAEQPWHIREVASNGKQTWRTSENYSRRFGAETALISHVRSLHPGIRVWFSTGTGGSELRIGMPGDTYLSARVLHLRDVDERETP